MSSLDLPSEHKTWPDLNYDLCFRPADYYVCDLRFEQIIPLIDW